MGYWIEGSGFWVLVSFSQPVGFGVQGQGLAFGNLEGLGLRALGLRFKVWGLGFKVYLGFSGATSLGSGVDWGVGWPGGGFATVIVCWA